MSVLELTSWVGYGVILALMVEFFLRKRRGFAIELMLVGAAGGLLGGLFGRFVLPEVDLRSQGQFDVISFLTAVAAAALCLYIDWMARVRHHTPSATPRSS